MLSFSLLSRSASTSFTRNSGDEMGYAFISLMGVIIIGVILANMIHNAKGTSTFFNGLGNLWGKSINGLLGKPSKS